MGILDSYTEKIELIFKRWLRDLVYIFVAIIFTAFLASLNQVSGVMDNVVTYVKEHPAAITYDGLLHETLNIIRISARPISFFLITIFTLSFFYTTLTIDRMLKIDLMLKKDIKQHFDFHYYFLLVCFNSIFAGLTSYIGSSWLGLNYIKIISIMWVIIVSNFILSCWLIFLILKFTFSGKKIMLRWSVFFMILIINSYWIWMAFNRAIWLLPYPIRNLLLFLFIVIIWVVFYEMRKTRRCLKG